MLSIFLCASCIFLWFWRQQDVLLFAPSIISIQKVRIRKSLPFEFALRRSDDNNNTSLIIIIFVAVLFYLCGASLWPKSMCRNNWLFYYHIFWSINIFWLHAQLFSPRFSTNRADRVHPICTVVYIYLYCSMTGGKGDRLAKLERSNKPE